MGTISLCMIVKNESAVLARCLDSVQGIVDEIVIVDTGSTDDTKEIAARYTDKIYDFEWIDDFAAARNFAFSKGTMEFLMWLDADDVLLEKDREALLELKGQLTQEIDLVMMRYQVAFDDHGNPTFFYYRERLMRREAGYRWAGAVHETITLTGRLLYSQAAVTHKKIGPGDPDRNLRIFEKLRRQGKELEPRELFYYARELYYHGQYEKAAQQFTAFLDGDRGWKENCIDACQLLAQCYQALGMEERVLPALYRSLDYDGPRAEVCCALGWTYLQRGLYQQAIFWYQTASTRQADESSGAFIQKDCYDYIPYIQLCICYDKMGDYDTASRYNAMALKAKPGDTAALSNKAYFEKILGRT